ncbi:cation:proton antiporter [Deinococcus sp. QL22]|uniref:cation:proton antiporter domain-containing protein n=1 Tax=Deinococcus sp. QL22 TaxID=2939437 RepID=UPI00201720C3|nr:cation:proton antiporter [Deinococcus sp. QL22]UQN08270.1 cation:proton antiporter [Deinococcus sp. QL22]
MESVGGGLFALLTLFDLSVPLVYCLQFGAPISPTDPVAVLGLLKQAKVPRRIETLVAGESLFNDGVGVVAFAVLAGVAAAASGAHGPALRLGKWPGSLPRKRWAASCWDCWATSRCGPWTILWWRCW